MTSRTPVNGVGYDKSLLADAPEVTKADKQEGYNPDLLEQGKRPSQRPGAVPAASNKALAPGAKYGGSDSSHNRRHITTTAPTQEKRSKKIWFIVAGIVFLIVVAVAVGAGVGVSKSKNKTKNDNANPPTQAGTQSTDLGGNGSDTTVVLVTTDAGGKPLTVTSDVAVASPTPLPAGGDSNGGSDSVVPGGVGDGGKGTTTTS